MADVHSILAEYWGYDEFRPLQEEIITSVLEGKDVLAVLPTGGGKSICFQVPAMASEGICIVVSPLIALMKDQVENLRKRSIPALLIHSGMSRADVERTLKNAMDSYFKFLYVSPERLETSLFKEYLPGMQVNLIAVDESHCVSQWGYDFRPSYLRISTLRESLPQVPLLALTASATPLVQDDIMRQLQMKKPVVYRQSFARNNLSYSAYDAPSKYSRMVEILQKVPGTALVYCKSRKRTVEVARLLQGHGLSADYYHAGLSTEERNQKQNNWIQNNTRIMACTNAFGMGIDKPDVRLVIHLDPPDCLENYYQEAGRAGRDGKKSYAVLLYNQQDLEELRQLHSTRYPEEAFIKQVYQAIGNYLQVPVYTAQDQRFNFHFDQFIQNFKLPAQETLYAFKALEQDGWIEYNEKNFTPSTLQFTTGKSSLYEFENSYPQHEPLLTTLLRTYEGVFDFPCFISEIQLARLMRREEKEIKDELLRISGFGVIRYQPRNDDPQLIFRKHRVAAENLVLNRKAYQERRELFIERTGQMISYAETENCRSQFIGKYFGEDKPPACGICDRCLEKKSKALTPEEFNQLTTVVLSRLDQSHCSIDEMLTLMAIRKEKAWEVIHFLQAEKKIRALSDGMLALVHSE